MIWLWSATLCAFFIKGLCGFANSLVFTTLMSFRDSIINISPVILLINFPTNLIMVWNGRKSVDRKIMNEAAAKKIVLIMLVISGLALTISSL